MRIVGHSYQMVDLGDWIEAHEIAPYFRGDTLLDWLKLFGERNGFPKDTDQPGYDPDCEMSTFLAEKATGFKEAFASHARRAELSFAYLGMSRSSDDSKGAMQEGIQLIASPFLVDSVRRVTARPDFLIRVDVLGRLFEEPPDLEETREYVVMNLRLGRITLNARGRMKTDASLAVHRARLFLCNCALAELVGEAPTYGLLVGRGWQQAIGEEEVRGSGCLDKAGVVDLSSPKRENEVADALQWVRRLRREGGEWSVFPSPSIPELRPNAGNRYDFPWHRAKIEIAERLKDPILLWNVGADKRDRALANGITTYDHPEASAEVFGLTHPDKIRVLDALLHVVRNPHLGVQPSHVEAAREVWGEPQALEFFVDFETVNNSDDDFARFPQAGGQPLIFMVGCGHMEHGVWKFENFIAERATEGAEAKVIADWLHHMESTRLRLAPHLARPICFHWSAAEDNTFRGQYDSFRKRHPEFSGEDPNWFDFLARVIRAEPVIVPGALGFGLKALAKAMFNLGHVQVLWDEGPSDGLGAMVGAWRAYARCGDRPVSSDPLMQGIAKYNNIDCLAMQQIIDWLRRNR